MGQQKIVMKHVKSVILISAILFTSIAVSCANGEGSK